MKKGGSGGPPSWSGLAKAGVGKIFDMFGGYPPYAPGRDQDGAWIPLGEPSTPTANAQRLGVFWALPGGIVDTPGGAPLCAILIESPRASLGQAAAPVFPKLTLACVDGQMDVMQMIVQSAAVITNGVGINVNLDVGVGIYRARYDNATNLYEIQDPLGASDASRFDWIYLEARTFQFKANVFGAITTGSTYICFPSELQATPKVFDFTKVDFNQVIGPGEAIMLCVNTQVEASVNVGSVTSTAFQPNVRGFLKRGS